MSKQNGGFFDMIPGLPKVKRPPAGWFRKRQRGGKKNNVEAVCLIF